MEKRMVEIVEAMSAEEAKRVLRIISEMYLDEYPLTDRDLADLLNENEKDVQK